MTAVTPAQVAALCRRAGLALPEPQRLAQARRLSAIFDDVALLAELDAAPGDRALPASDEAAAWADFFASFEGVCDGALSSPEPRGRRPR